MNLTPFIAENHKGHIKEFVVDKKKPQTLNNGPFSWLIVFGSVLLCLGSCKTDKNLEENRVNPRESSKKPEPNPKTEDLTKRIDTADSKPRCKKPVHIPEGEYIVGSDRGQPDERPVKKIKIEAFQIDRCEVTIGRYKECVRKKGCTPVAGSGKKQHPDLPVTGVSYTQAMMFCKWEGKTLPTEEQWEAAARGKNGFRFPWGQEASCFVSNYGSYDQQGPCASINPGHPEKVGIRPKGKSPFGVLDMAGNVWEWTRCRGSCDPKVAVLKGGSCCSMFLLPRSANRWKIPIDYQDKDIGFRCVKIH
jgi:formylglycine-generating enzyme required for sulfatase activity